MVELNRSVSRKTRASVPHGVKPEIIVTLYPGGTVGLRESGRRKVTEVYFDLGSLYVRGVTTRIANERRDKTKARNAEKKLRKSLR